ncbi:MAG TPA: indole-3-glycerol phosphate synthase TrpC [bacterium]
MLERILARKRDEIAEAKRRVPPEEIRARAGRSRVTRGFREALAAPGRVHLIAELKRKSPSKGMLRERFDPVRLAQELEEAGASALSVLTDERFFGGSQDILRDVRAFTELPVLRKDFILEPYQVYESAALGADAVLLIVRALDAPALSACLAASEELGMDALVEIHAEEELDAALAGGARLIGINHRDLATFELDPGLSERLVGRIPAGCVVVAESGVRTSADVARMAGLGVHALLIGEALMIAPDAGARVRELFGALWSGPPPDAGRGAR